MSYRAEGIRYPMGHKTNLVNIAAHQLGEKKPADRPCDYQVDFECNLSYSDKILLYTPSLKGHLPQITIHAS